MRYVRKVAIIIFVLAFLFGAAGFSASISADNGQNKSALPDRLLVQFKPGTTGAQMSAIHRNMGAELESVIPAIGVHIVKVPQGQGFSKAKAYGAQSEVNFVEADSVAQIVDVPNDSYYGSQWGLGKVLAPQAWDITRGSSSVRIAILDTGIDLEHPDLASKIVSSINFTASPTADANGHSHGTHVAGIAAAITNNAMGVAGLGRNSSLMNVKVLGDDGYGYYSWIAQGIIWAADNGAQVINLSLGGSTASSTLENAVNYAWNKGAIVVAAAGNDGSTSAFYPAYYANCIAVGATDSNDNITSWSNYGSWVDVAAPGSSIYSTMPDNLYGYKSGTSMASPHVAGLAGLVFSVANDANSNGRLNDEVRAKIETSCDYVGAGVAYGRINAYQAVLSSASDPTPTPTPAPTPTPTPAPMPTPTPTPAPTPTPTPTPAPTPTPTPTPAPAPEPKPIWVESITFKMLGKNMRLDVKVVGESGAVSGAQVGLDLSCSCGQNWAFNSTTDSSGVISFTVNKAPAGSYETTITGLTASGYTWDTTQGITSASYTLNGSTSKPIRR